MSRIVAAILAGVALVACNAESPTALADFNPASIKGRFSVSFSSATCSVGEIEMSFTQVSNGGALPDTILLVGSWQTVGKNEKPALNGRLVKATGEVSLSLIQGVRFMEGIVLDNDNLAFGYTDVTTPCTARAAARRVD